MKGENRYEKAENKINFNRKKGEGICHHAHKIGDTFDFDTQRGSLCPMVMHVAFPYIDILRYGGNLPFGKQRDFRFCCPDADVINIFRIEKIE